MSYRVDTKKQTDQKLIDGGEKKTFVATLDSDNECEKYTKFELMLARRTAVPVQ